jgi:protein TonB
MAYTPGGSYGIETDGAFIQLFSGSPATNTRWFGDPRATVISYRGGGRSNTGVPGVSRQTFDQAEEHAIAEATRNAQRGSGAMVTTAPGPGGTSLRSSVSMGAPITASPGGVTLSEAPVRVGSSIAQPQKIYDVEPNIPATAAQAGVHGTVILEIIIGADGAVSSTKVLRSIPMLDQAALDAVRRWRYRPTLINGQPVPVIMTVTVNFP